MMVEALRIALVVLLMVAVPGWLLVKALFPRREDLHPLEVAYMSLAGGVLLVMLIASILGFLPHGGRGHLQSLATGGLPNVELLLLGSCAGLYLVGLRRGAFARFTWWPAGTRSQERSRAP